MCQILSGATYTATPGMLTSVTSVRALTTIGTSTNNNIVFKFTAPDSVQNGEQIYIKMPVNQVMVPTPANF